MTEPRRHGGDLVSEVLARHGVRTLFTLCGGHISPILVGAKALGIRVADVRHESAAVFAADATARLTGIPGVAAVTAGPGLTNVATAVQNARMAQSPVVVLGGATATILKGRGSLQDIDQESLATPLFKWQGRARRLRELAPLVSEAFWRAAEGVPGPVFVECPVDLLYPEAMVREWYGVTQPVRGAAIAKRIERAVLGHHLGRLFHGGLARAGEAIDRLEASSPPPPEAAAGTVRRAARRLAGSRRPVVVVGSPALVDPERVPELVTALETFGAPVWLSGMARGLLGADHPLLFRHRRKEALREADLVLLAGVPCDFRLDYGRSIGGGARVVAAHRDRDELTRNRAPSVAALGDPARFLIRVAEASGAPPDRSAWFETLRAREDEREADIARSAEATAEAGVSPLALLRALDARLDERALLVADGGDFVGTASYVVRPRSPLSWLDPGVFGTLGVGGGFALGAAIARPDAETWLLWGDGSVGFSLAEFDTFARLGVPVIALVGNDASWAQIARDQVTALGDAVGTELAPTDYERAAEGLGGVGLRIDCPEEIGPVLDEACRRAADGAAVLVNARLAPSDFRKGSISL